MEIDLGDYLKRFGLGVKWLWLMRSLDIKTVTDAKIRVQEEKTFKELRRNVRPNEVEYFDHFIRNVKVQQSTKTLQEEVDPSESQQTSVSVAEKPQREGDSLSMQNISGNHHQRSYTTRKKVTPEETPGEDTGKNSHCLRLYLENAGLNSDKYCSLLATERITSLRDLQIIFQDRVKHEQLFKGLCERDEENLQDILCENLDEAVQQEDILHRLGLLPYYPEKISLPVVMKKSCDNLKTLTDIPWYVLSKLLMLDYRGRDDVLPKTVEESSGSMSNRPNNQENDLDNLFSTLSEDSLQTLNSYVPHPMDVLVVLLQCSSNFLRQLICEKLFLCKLSIPFIMPQFINSKPLMQIWAIRNIVLKDKHTNGDTFDRSAVNTPTLLVSCVRLGKVSRSKSKLLNEILNGQKHDTYFHKDCMNGMVDRIHSRDLIEAAWYLPSSRETTKNLNSAVLLLNHRGDGNLDSGVSKYLLKVSNVVIVMVDVSEISKPHVMSTLKAIPSKDSDLILMLSKHPNASFDGKGKEAIRRCAKELESPSFKGENIILDFTLNGEKNIKDLKNETVTKINKSLHKGTKGFVLEDLKNYVKFLKITVDENTPECLSGQSMAKKLQMYVKRENIDHAKRKFLPLQCEPWQKWAQLSKETHRLQYKSAEESRDKYVAKVQDEMLKRREEQLKYMKSMNDFFHTFLDDILGNMEYERLYYLRWLRFYLDDISRKIIPSLQKRYGSVMEEISHLGDDDEAETLRKELDALASQMDNASFGLEHLMREIGQAYEAACTLGKKVSGNLKEKIDNLPHVFAELLLRGYPLELMDGDASHVPVTWIRAVLHRLGTIIGKEKKIFVLSVLGIQSSGKSTLLNTMFGLQFAVAAGRCTRGVYAQLIPLQKEHPNRKYDFMLVVDTEGLRAPELGRVKHEHDNEIATLVIGLGDVTIVNVKGENVAEMEDVLQIVVHAMLKMRLVNKSLKLQPSIIFIHQNVGAPDAAQKLKSGQQKLIETLNKVTKAAGEQEDSPEYTKFKQVIDFDINKHIHYFSDLWKGDPPMAPTNCGYSEKVASVRQSLLNDIMVEKGSNLNIPKISLRIEDLWKGILDQNFVFSFRNSLTMKVYTIIEKVLSDMKWELTNYRMKWLNKKENKIMSNEKDLDELLTELTKQCHSDLRKEYRQKQGELNAFFEKNEEQEVYEQWKDNSTRKLKESYKENVFKAIRGLEGMIMNRKKQDERNTHQLKEEMFKQAKMLAESLKSEQNLHEKSLKKRFNGAWSDWMRNINEDFEDHVDVHRSVMNILFNHFRMDQAVMQKVLDDEERERIKKNFTDAIKYQIVKQDTGKASTTRKTTSVIDSLKSLFNLKESDVEKHCFRLSAGKRDTDRKIAHMFIKKLYGHIKLEVGKMLHPQNFNLDYGRSLIHLILDMVTGLHSLGIDWKSPLHFSIDISVRSCWLACYEFSKSHTMQNQSRQKERNPIGQLADVHINSDFKAVLAETFPDDLDLVNKELEKCYALMKMNADDLKIDVDTHVTISSSNQEKNFSKQIIRKDIFKHVNNLKEEIKQYIADTEVQDFKEEYILNILHSIAGKVQEIENGQREFKFTKVFRIRLSIFICYFVIPMFTEKHKRYMEKVHPRFIIENKYKKPCFQVFKEQYLQSGKEKALANVVSKLIVSAIERMVDNDMPRLLAEDVRVNVKELSHKSALLPAVLSRLLEDGTFEDFLLLFADFSLSFDSWIITIVNNYVFHSDDGNKTKYTEIASDVIKTFISEFCEEFESITHKVADTYNGSNSFKSWVEELQARDIEDLQLVQRDLMQLTKDYRNIDITSFMEHLKSELEKSQDKLCEIFETHTESHLESAHEDSVYSLISQTCRGCKAKCPLCNAPCALSTENHIEEGMNHIAMEHYPLSCAGIKWQDDKKLLTENCPSLVASDLDFENEDTNYESHAYKDYKQLYPSWDIDSDSTREISHYWKWFLMQFSYDLATKYKAEMPALPLTWKTVTIEMARQSLRKYDK